MSKKEIRIARTRKNRSHDKGGKKQAKEYHDALKQDYKNRPKINKKNYLMKKKIRKENMEETDREIRLKNINKN